MIDDFKGLPFDVLFPVRRWLGDQPWRMRWVQALLFFALFPLSLTHLWGIDAEIQDAAWAIGTYFALLWGYVLWAIVQPGQLKRRNLFLITVFTAIVGVFLVLTLQKLPFISALYSATEWNFSPARLVGFVAGVGLVEEAVKLLPVFWLAVKWREIRTPREAAFYAGISGLAFGVAEAVAYSIHYTDTNTFGMTFGLVGSGNYVVSEFLRLITLPFLHCVFSGIAGYYLGLSLLAPQRRTALLLLGVGVTALLHGLYDFFAGGWLGLGVAGVAIVTFVAYLRSAEHITQHITGKDEPIPPVAPTKKELV
ncbi:PrsW family intramembrane metalloprotease [Deinococcus sp. HMF7620]|uniref:PrsW family intramembrane metalloprotease n=1 Tax=Deinococcus arboris TaxID=2682977 RepID=A0A7C9M3T8_9DEIO|nr:PrsW family glutamic-type intramembrane protease [Deinococcus arboris]MVN85305.1 PrsW family intramembrane metalloprotease [Deinococcus arboris]